MDGWAAARRTTGRMQAWGVGGIQSIGGRGGCFGLCLGMSRADQAASWSIRFDAAKLLRGLVVEGNKLPASCTTSCPKTVVVPQPANCPTAILALVNSEVIDVIATETATSRITSRVT